MSLAWLHAAAAADRALSIPVQITHAENFDPFPSPDGKKLVFISMLSSREQLFTMNADGSNIVQLTRDDVIPPVIRRIIFLVASSTALMSAEFFFGGTRSSLVQ